MASISIADISILINQQLQVDELIEESLEQLNALLQILLLCHGHFPGISNQVSHSYFGLMEELLAKALEIHRENIVCLQRSPFRNVRLSH